MNIKSTNTAQAVVVLSLIALACAMGIGRFAFTPMLPLVQTNDGVTVVQGAMLASANYVGYLVGAILCGILAPNPRRCACNGLMMVALTTIAMAVAFEYSIWLLLRFISGVASAFVLVGISAWALPALTQLGAASKAGWIYSGVGVGIVFTGFTGLVADLQRWPTSIAWFVLGAISGVIAIFFSLLSLDGESDDQSSASGNQAQPLTREQWALVLCYSTLGFGYIVPATFLPSMAKAMIPDPTLFGWIWPLFGVAASISTAVASKLFRMSTPRTIASVSLVIMACGVAAPVLWSGVLSFLVAAVCVGGTFMVATMAGMQEARRIANANATRLMAMLTAGFALGQLGGPILVAIAASRGGLGITVPSALAVVALLVGAWGFRFGAKTKNHSSN